MAQQENHENIRQLIAREGKSARNLVAWSVPVISSSESPRHRIPSKAAIHRRPGKLGRRAKRTNQARAPPSTREDSALHARYWSYLFDNLHRAVDEVYATCEADESIVECQEVLLSLEQSRKDFEALIRRIQLFQAQDQDRPASLAWEVRKTSSPVKTRHQNHRSPLHKSRPPPDQPKPRDQKKQQVTRTLKFNEGETPTWADRVRGYKPPTTTAREDVVTSGPHVLDTRVADGDQKDAHSEHQGEHDETINKDASANVDNLNQHKDIIEDSDDDMCHLDQEDEDNGDGDSDGGGWEMVSRSRSRSSSSCSRPNIAQKKPSKTRSQREEEPATPTITTPTLPTPTVVVESPVANETTQPNQSPPDESPGEKPNTPPQGTTESQETAPWTWNDVMADYDAGESYRSSVDWADRCDSPPLSEVPRSPGRAVHLHQRLSSPSRRRVGEDVEQSRRLAEEKQMKAEQTRSRLQEEKSNKYKIASDKVREAKQSRESRIQQQREALEGKLQRAEMLRVNHLQEIVRKAQEEEAKVSEISFINTLEAQNKKMEVMERHEVHKARLQELADERQRKKEELLAKGEAAMERRKALESERLAKLEEQEVKRREQEAKIELMRLEKERAREDVAREKARERERKLEARNAAIQISVEELERKIQLKHDESSRRYGQQLEQKKLVAVTTSRHASSDDAPNVEAYKRKKWCTVCEVKIISEVYLMSHLRGRRHQEALATHSGGDPVIIEANEEQERLPEERLEVTERMKAGKKRAKKLRARMSARVKEGVSVGGAILSSKNKARVQRAIRELSRCLESSGAAEKPLGELARTLSMGDQADMSCFVQSGGLAAVMTLVAIATGPEGKAPSDRALQHAISVLQYVCPGNHSNCVYLVLSNKMAVLIDLALKLLPLSLPSTQGPKIPSLCSGVLGLVAAVMSTLSPPSQELSPAMADIISYLVSTGLVDLIAGVFSSITGPISDPPLTQLTLAAINLILAATACLHTRVVSVWGVYDDPCQLAAVLRQTELVHLMQLLYAILLHDGPPRHSTTPPQLSSPTLCLATAAVKALNNAAILDLPMVQSCLGSEGVSLEFRHIVSYLLWFCSHNNNSCLLHELILAVGYFSVLNTENQVFLQSGRSPTLLQLLCDLPFQYFSNPELTGILFPSLICACYKVPENLAILQQEISPKLLVSFLKDRSSQPSQEKTQFNELEHRFPKPEWPEAIKFFNQ